MPLKIYLAGPLFSLSEKDFNKKLALVLEQKIRAQVILPQEGSLPFEGKDNFAELAFHFCIDQIQDCDLVLALLEGPDADSGTCVEIGFAYSLKKPILGIRTDFRASEDNGVNLMISQACTLMIWDKSIQDLDTFSERIIIDLKRLFPDLHNF